MKKKLVSIVLAALMVASLTTACGNSKAETPAETAAPAAETPAETAAPAAETQAETSTPAEETKPEAETAPAESSEEEEFTLLDVTADMIEAGVYAISEDQTELVFSMFTEPSGTPMASLFLFTADGSGDVICGTYTGESETDEDGIDWTVLIVSDVYTGEDFEIGFGESDDEVYIFDTEDGTPYEGKYLSADETIDYMGAAVALLEEGGSASEDFTLLDVSADMIEAGVYAVSEDKTELVFSMFTDPSGTPMASLFLFTADGSGDVICGTYTGESETDEDGIDWTLLIVSDVYTGEDFEIGFGESGDEVYIFDTEDGTPYEGKYLSADETIDYMGAAAALLE